MHFFFLQKIPYLALANRRRRGKAHHEPVAKWCFNNVQTQEQFLFQRSIKFFTSKALVSRAKTRVIF
ncbi:hypothetical protein HBZS_118340 [Helicobacter bizzozeronii CCUG 35545]|nr:hypothetical protein HBZS_118340 [Helicobacter bizzozeronii CCUG 35545]